MSTLTGTNQGQIQFDSDEDQDLVQRIKSLRNKHSVVASAVGKPVEIRASHRIGAGRIRTGRIELPQEGRIVGERARAFGRGGTVDDPWHYVSVLARKPGALRNGALFKNWELRASTRSIRRQLKAAPDSAAPELCPSRSIASP